VIVSISTLVKADTPLFEVHGRTYSNVSVRVPTRHLTIKKPHYKTIKVQLLRSRCSSYCSPYGNRTRDSAVKGQRLNPLPNGPSYLVLQRYIFQSNLPNIFLKILWDPLPTLNLYFVLLSVFFTFLNKPGLTLVLTNLTLPDSQVPDKTSFIILSYLLFIFELPIGLEPTALRP